MTATKTVQTKSGDFAASAAKTTVDCERKSITHEAETAEREGGLAAVDATRRRRNYRAKIGRPRCEMRAWRPAKRCAIA